MAKNSEAAIDPLISDLRAAFSTEESINAIAASNTGRCS